MALMEGEFTDSIQDDSIDTVDASDGNQEELRDFEELTPEQQEEEVARAITIIEAAEAAEIKLTALDIAILLGYNSPSKASKLFDKVKDVLPKFKSRKEKFSSVIESIHEMANWENEERDLSTGIEKWFSELTPDQQNNLSLKVVGGGSEMNHKLKLVVQDSEEISIDIERTVNLPKIVLDKMKEEDLAFLTERKQYWESIGIENGPGITEFIKAHFEIKEISVEKTAPEIEWLIKEMPEAKEIILELQSQGIELNLQKVSDTPDAVLDAIRHIAVKSQHKYVSTWLPHLLKEGADPVVLESDEESIRKTHEIEMNNLEKIAPKGAFGQEFIRTVLDEELSKDLDFISSIDLIKDFSSHVISITTEQELSDEQKDLLEKLNAKISEGISGEYSRRKLIADDAARNSEGAKKIIYGLAVMGPAVEVVQNTLHLGGAAKFLAAAGDDMASEAAELSALKGAGMSNEELRARIKQLIPVGVVALVLSSLIEKAEETVNPHVAGLLFSTSAIALSVATAALSVKYFADNYKVLAAEGKIPDKYKIDDEVLRRLSEISDEPVSLDEMLSSVSEALDESGCSEEDRKEIVEQVKKFAESRDMEEIIEAIKSPSKREALAAGFKEAVAVNPARLGLAIGQATAPVVGFAFGPVFLANPLLYAVAGSYESIVGAITMWVSDKTFEYRWQRYLDSGQEEETAETIPSAQSKVLT